MLEEFNRAGVLMRLMLRYTQALMTQIAQTAVCNRHHTVQQQLCRWLLLNLDRMPSNELTMTHVNADKNPLTDDGGGELIEFQSG